MTDPTRARARIAALERLAARPDEDIEALGADVPESHFDPLLAQAFAMLEEREADAVARGEAPSFTADQQETTIMTDSRNTRSEASEAGLISTVTRRGIAMLRFSAALLRQGEAAVAPALAGFRRSDQMRSDFERMPWRPSHLEMVGDPDDGNWTLCLDGREIEAVPADEPAIELWIDNHAVDEESLEIGYDQPNRGQILVGFQMEAEALNVDVSVDRADRVVIDIWTKA